MGLSNSRSRRQLILALFFLSGACGLVYEVVWMRMLTLVFGATAFATSAILASFFAGLALGSWYFGRMADRLRNPLALYAPMPPSSSAYAFLFPVLGWLDDLGVVTLALFLVRFIVKDYHLARAKQLLGMAA